MIDFFKKSNYKEKRENENFFIIWNDKKNDYERIPKDIYINTINNLVSKNTINNNIRNDNILSNFVRELNKNINIENIVDENDTEKKQIEKFYNIINELKQKENNKEEGDK